MPLLQIHVSIILITVLLPVKEAYGGERGLNCYFNRLCIYKGIKPN